MILWKLLNHYWLKVFLLNRTKLLKTLLISKLIIQSTTTLILIALTQLINVIRLFDTICKSITNLLFTRMGTNTLRFFLYILFLILWECKYFFCKHTSAFIYLIHLVYLIMWVLDVICVETVFVVNWVTFALLWSLWSLGRTLLHV